MCFKNLLGSGNGQRRDDGEEEQGADAEKEGEEESDLNGGISMEELLKAVARMKN